MSHSSKLVSARRDELDTTQLSLFAPRRTGEQRETTDIETKKEKKQHSEAAHAPTEVRRTTVRAKKSAGYSAADITYLAHAHYHSDHTANSNDFANSTWLVHPAERDVMFAEKPQGIIQPAMFSALKNAKTKLLTEADYDVFGDGTVVIKYTPGHTPGHQVLFLRAVRI